MTRTARFAERLLAIRPTSLSPVDIGQVERLILDLVGVAYAGSAKPWVKAMQRWAQRYDTVGKAGVFGGSLRLPAGIAALVNGTAGHSYELDDTHDLSLSHPGSVVIPTALAVASETGSSGADTIAAIVAGYQAIAVIGTAANGGRVIERGHHPTAVFGGFGAAAAAASLYGLTPPQLAIAWGHVLSLAAGSLQFSDETKGTDVKRVHAGYAAQHGILAAELAMNGVEAPHDSLEGKYGFLKLYGHDTHPEVLEAVDQDLAIHAISFKPYACCRFFHSTIDALRAVTRDFKDDRRGIETIVVRGPGVIGDQHMMRRPESPMAAQYSLPYVIGATIEFGPTGFAAYDMTNLSNTAILGWADLVRFETEARLEASYPAHLGTEVEIVYRGERRVDRVLDSVGTVARPLSWAQIAAKIAGLTHELRPPLDIERLEHAIRTLHDSDGIAALDAAMTVPAKFATGAA